MDQKLTLTEHLEELRSRAIKSVVSIIVTSCILYSFVDMIIPRLARPVGRLVFIAPHEAFIAGMQISFFLGLFLSSPLVFYQIWRFVSSGLKPSEKKYALMFGPLSIIFFFLGAFFGYSIIIPIGMRFLLSFATDAVTPMISISRYITFIGTLTLSFGVIFELPLISLFLTKVGLITPKLLLEKRRHAVVLMFILAAILTPPDVITQCLMAAPLLVLYEFSIIFSKFAYKK